MDGGKAAPGRRAGEGEGATPKGGAGDGRGGGEGASPGKAGQKKRGGHAGEAGRKEGAAEKKFTTKSIRCRGNLYHPWGKKPIFGNILIALYEEI